MPRWLSRWPFGLSLLVTMTRESPAQNPSDTMLAVLPSAITGWRSGRTPGVESVALYRSPPAAGPYVARTRFQPGAGLGPHYHDSTVTITVIGGRFRLGIGSAIDTSAARAYPLGSFLVLPAGTPHYEWGEGETVIQLSGNGPMGFTRIPAAGLLSPTRP